MRNYTPSPAIREAQESLTRKFEECRARMGTNWVGHPQYKGRPIKWGDGRTA